MKQRGSGQMKRIRTSVFLLTAVLALALAGPFTAFADDVITGKDGWYFYDSDGSVEDYQGSRFFTDLQLQKMKSDLRNAENKLNERGIEFVIMLTPNKETIYPEYMPDSYGQPASYTRIDQVYDYLKDDFRIIYPKEELLTAKALWPQYDFYYKTDSHWNNLGGYIGAQALAKELGLSLPDLSSVNISESSIPGMDLAGILNIDDIVAETDYALQNFGPYASTVRDEDEYGNYYWYYTQGAPERTLTIYGDSYSLAVVPYMGQLFENVYLHRFTDDESIIDAEQPSAVVYQILERFLDLMV